MGKWDVDFDGYEERGGGYSGEQPKPGMYEAILQDYEEHENGQSETSLHFVFEITEDGEYTGFRSHAYSDLENAKWKTQMIAKAIQGGDEKPMSFDPKKKEKVLAAAKPVMLVLRKGEYDGEYRANFGRVLPLADATSGKKKASTTEAAGGKKKGKKGKGETDPWATPSDD